MNCCHRARSSNGARQSGAALIIAIFVLALAMVLITALSTRFVIAARRTDNQVLADQAWYYLTGAEQLATELLLAQLRDRAEQQLDTLYRPELFGQYETDDGWLAFSVLDLQGPAPDPDPDWMQGLMRRPRATQPPSPRRLRRNRKPIP
jgi:type II secretory pathway component PulK